jgi:hypothetical protein
MRPRSIAWLQGHVCARMVTGNDAYRNVGKSFWAARKSLIKYTLPTHAVDKKAQTRKCAFLPEYHEQ